MIRLAVIDKLIKESAYSIHRIEENGPIKYVVTSDYQQQTIESKEQDEQTVVVLNVSLKGKVGEELLKQIENREAKVCLYLSTEHNSNESHLAQKGVLASADWILLNDTIKNTLVEEIDNVLNQGKRINPKIANRIIKFITHPQLKQWDTVQKLTCREIEIMNLVADGYPYKEVANRLNISFQTLKTHLKNIFTKMSVNTRVEATLKYTKHNGEIPESTTKK